VISLNIPLTGATRGPLEFYSDPDRRQVFLPVASIKFIDDLAVAYAYYQRHGCDIGLVSDYAAVLHFRQRYAQGPPFDALGIPRTAANDPYVDDLANKLHKTIMYFIVAHEYAHVLYRHRNYGAITAPEAQQQEIHADAFALNVMGRIGAPPFGVTFFFLVASRLEPSPGDFSSLAEYESHLREHATHPVSALRILTIADSIQNNIHAFARLEPNSAAAESALQRMVPQLREIAGGLDDRKMRLFLSQQAETVDMAALRDACNR
jgi:hypothetical protein